MADEQKSKLRLEIAHVLFIDIVGYSKLRINEQSAQIEKLREIVRGTEQFRTAEAEGKLLRLPTGDGGALVFRNSPEAPVLCAEEIARALKSHPGIQVRMGIHSGPVNEGTDLTSRRILPAPGSTSPSVLWIAVTPVTSSCRSTPQKTSSSTTSGNRICMISANVKANMANACTS